MKNFKVVYSMNFDQEQAEDAPEYSIVVRAETRGEAVAHLMGQQLYIGNRFEDGIAVSSVQETDETPKVTQYGPLLRWWVSGYAYSRMYTTSVEAYSKEHALRQVLAELYNEDSDGNALVSVHRVSITAPKD